jgi:O-antigen ligase
MYMMEMVQFGMVGLLALLWLFYTQLRFALSSHRSLIKHLGVALPFLYFIISFGESYLSIHQTGLMFSVMSAFLYKDYKLKQ